MDEAEGKMSSVLQENLTGIRVVRAFARQEYEERKFEEKNAVLRDEKCRLIFLLALFWSSTDFLCFTQVFSVLAVGVHLCVQGALSLGTFVVFLTYIGLLVWPIRHMGRILSDMGQTFVAVGRIQRILEENLEEVEKLHGDVSKASIAFDKVHFSYVPGIEVLDDISFRVKPGETVAIVGPTGAGKSTLMHLLLRLYDYKKGSITVDGKELKRISKYEIRRKVGIVLQEPFLYSKTIRENVRLANENVTESQMLKATEIADIHENHRFL